MLVSAYSVGPLGSVDLRLVAVWCGLWSQGPSVLLLSGIHSVLRYLLLALRPLKWEVFGNQGRSCDIKVASPHQWLLWKEEKPFEGVLLWCSRLGFAAAQVWVLLWHRSDPQPRNFHGAQQKKKKSHF